MAQEIKVDLTKTGGLLVPPWETPPTPPAAPDVAPQVVKAENVPAAEKKTAADPPKEPEKPKFSEEVALDFQRAVLTGRAYEETKVLFGGAVVVTFRDPSVADERAVADTILAETTTGTYQTGFAGAAVAMRRGAELRKTAAVHELRRGGIVYTRPTDKPLTEAAKLLDEAVGSTTVLVALDRAYDEFMSVLEELRTWATKESFFPAVVPGGFSPAPHTAATRR